MDFSESDLLKIAKRYKNAKRNYLLVNPLQAKHVPVSPRKSLEMMRALGALVREICPNPVCLIGFAETATAIASVVANEIPVDTLYLQTTRENCAGNLIPFFEEHSHAPEQWICFDALQALTGGTIVLIDDEISTGKTVLNFIDQFSKYTKNIRAFDFLVASIINRIPDEKLEDFAEHSVRFVSLLHPSDLDYSEIVKNLSVTGPDMPIHTDHPQPKYISLTAPAFHARNGIGNHSYYLENRAFAESAYRHLHPSLNSIKTVLVLGTEECMLPAILLGEIIEQKMGEVSVYTHSTTRSPIGISDSQDYPILNGFRLHSFYAAERETYLYNIHTYDLIIVVSDSIDTASSKQALDDIMSIFHNRFKQLIYVGGTHEKHV